MKYLLVPIIVALWAATGLAEHIGFRAIDESVTWTVATSDPTTGAPLDADSVPSYRIYEDSTTTPILTGNMALLDSTNTDGLYSATVTLSAANGFEAGKSYTIYTVATVGGVSGQTIRNLTLSSQLATVQTRVTTALPAIAAGSNGGLPTVNASNQVAGVSGNVVGSVGSVATGGITSGSFAAGSITATAMAADAIGADEIAASAVDEIWNESAAEHQGAGSVGLVAYEWLDGNRLDAILDARASQTSVDTVDGIVDTISSNVTTIDGIIDNIYTAFELDTTVYRLTSNALEQSPAVNATTVADAVWDAARIDHQDAGSFGEAVPITGSVELDSTAIDAISADVWGTTTRTLSAGAITSSTFGAGAIDATAIATDAIGAAEIAANAIAASEIADGAIDAGALATDTITAAKIAANAITASEIDLSSETVAAVSGAVGSVTGAVGSVTGNVGGNVTGSVGSIGTGGITSTSFGSGAINATAIATDAIGAAEIAADAIGASEIAANAITAAEIDLSSETVAAVSGSVGSVTGAVGSVTGSVGSVTGSVGSVTGAVGSVTAAVTVGTNNDKTGYALSSAGVDAFWDYAVPVTPTVGSFEELIKTNLNTTVSSRLASSSYTAPLDAAGVRSAVGLTTNNLDTQLGDIPTTAEFNARTLTSASYATAATQTTIAGYIDTEVSAILADTGELQTDWVNGGRLDLILDARASQTSVDTIDGNVDSILVDTAEIGTDGAGLTAVPWNASWDAEVQSEAADALTAYAPATASALSTVDGIIDNIYTAFELDTDVYRLTTNALEQSPSGATAGDIADAVWTETLGDHTGVSGSAAESLNAAGSAGDPWTTALPGSYTGSQAGKVLSDILGYTDTEIAAIKTKTDFLPSATAGSTGGVLIAGTNASATFTSGITANITGNLSGSVGSVTGSVGSVTGAVGSVTGNVGGNVTGSVGSISGVTFPTGFNTLTVANIQSGLATSSSVSTLQTSVDGVAGEVWDFTVPGTPTVGSFEELVVGINATADSLTTAVADVPTVSEFNARTLASASYATATNQTTIAGYLDTEIAAILADTNELQTDWANGGRLDLLIDDVPTTSEFNARTLASASYATAANQTTLAGYVDTEVAAILADTAAMEPVIVTKLDSMIQLDGADYEFNAAAVEEAPTAGGATAEAVADAVWEEALADHSDTVGSTAESLASKLPTASYTTPLDAAGIRSAIGMAAADLDTQLDNIDATVDEGAIATAVWSNAARTLTAGTNIVLAKGTGVTGFNDLDAAGIRSAVGLASADLDTQFDNINATVDESAIATAVWANAARTLTAGTNIVLAKGTGVTGFTDLDASGIRSALGLASANLDTQLGALPTAAENATEVRTELTTELARIDVATSTRLATGGYTAPLDSTATQAAAAAALTAYDPPTKTELDSGLAGIDLGDGSTLTAIPWNVAWDTEVQSEATDALVAYDPPTKAEMDTGFGSISVSMSQEDRDEIIDGVASSISVTATLPSAHAVWKFTRRDTTTAANTVYEVDPFDGLAAMDFTGVIPDGVSISSITSVTATLRDGTAVTDELTIGVTSKYTDNMGVVIPLDVAEAGEYIIRVTIVTTDSQTITRLGRLTVR